MEPAPDNGTETAQDPRQIKIWDWPVRVSHWGFAVLVPAMWYTADNSLWWWHTRLGMVLFALLLFRLIWGFIGSRTARFASFVRGPKAMIAFLRGEGSGSIGHSPLGALSVIALLAVMSLQVGMGLFAGDPFDGATGPLNSLVGVLTADQLTEWHEVFVWVVLGLAGLHLAAIAFYALIRHNNLVGPMVTGSRIVSRDVAGIEPIGWLRPLFALVVSVALAIWVWLGAPPLT